MIKPKKEVEKIPEYNPSKITRNKYVRLDGNENKLGCSKEVLQKIKNVNKEEISSLPDYGIINKKISKYADVNPKQVKLTNGSDDAIRSIINSYVSKGEEALVIEPTFDIYEFFLTIAGAEINKINYNKDLSFPLEKTLRNITGKTKIVFLCNPNNPTGNLISKKDIQKILNKASKMNSIVLVDEAYYEFSGLTVKNLIEKFDNLFITRTFSKAFGLAGLRAGYVISNQKNIENLNKSYPPYAVSCIAKIAVDSALEDKKFMRKCVSLVKKNRKLLEKTLDDLNIKFYPSEANFILAKFPDSGKVKEKLKENNILVRDRSDKPLLENCLRITIGTKSEMDKLSKTLKRIMKPCLIFDMDGVLANVNGSYLKAIKDTVKFFTGKNISSERIRKLKIKGGYNNEWKLTQELIRRKGKIIDFNLVKDKFQQIYLGENFDGLISNEKLLIDKELLSQLYKNYKLAIVTGRPRREAEFFLKEKGIIDYFSSVICLEDTKDKGKPDPYGINLSLEKTDSVTGYYFGDNVDDMEASQRAGTASIGVLPPSKSVKDISSVLLENGANQVLGNINQIREVLK